MKNDPCDPNTRVEGSVAQRIADTGVFANCKEVWETDPAEIAVRLLHQLELFRKRARTPRGMVIEEVRIAPLKWLSFTGLIFALLLAAALVMLVYLIFWLQEIIVYVNYYGS